MEKNQTRRDYVREALAEFQMVVSLLAGFSFAGLTILIDEQKPGLLYAAAYTAIGIATISLICAAFVSSMLRLAVNFEPLDRLRWISGLLAIFGFGGIGAFLIGVVLLGFIGSLLVGLITGTFVFLCVTITGIAFGSLNRRYSKR